MIERAVRLFNLLIAVMCSLAGVAVLFVASFEQLAFNRGLRNRHGGDFFVGLAAVLGEPLARVLVAAMFFGLAWLFWRIYRPKSERRSHRRKG